MISTHKPLREDDEDVRDNGDQTDFRKTFILLLWLYILQGCVMSFPTTIKKVMTYEIDQCDDKREIDTLLGWPTVPFSLKLFVAPIVDHLDLPFFKNNKHYRGWIVVFGVLTFICMFFLALFWNYIDGSDACPNGKLLLAFLFPC